MIGSLRKKFIFVSAASILLVFAGIFSLFAVSTLTQLERTLDTLTDAVASNGGQFPEFEPSERSPLAEWLAYPDVITEETQFSTRFFVVWLDGTQQIERVNMDAVASIARTEIADYAHKAAAEGQSRGWVAAYRYRSVPAEDGTMLVFVNGSMQRNMTFRQLVTAFLILSGSAVLILFLTVFFSRRAVRPIEQSYEKQKQFITDASHELKTPLTLILSNLDIVEEECGKNEWLDDIRSEGERMRAADPQNGRAVPHG